MQSAEITDFYLNHQFSSYEDNQPGSNDRMARFLLEYCAKQDLTVLNIGCATALPLEFTLLKATNRDNKVARKAFSGVKLTSIDITMLNGARNVNQISHNIAQRNSPSFVLQAAAADFRQLPFKTDAFDVVVSNLAVDMLPGADRQLSLREAFRVLRPGGLLNAHLHCESMAMPIRRQSGFRINHYFTGISQILEVMEPLNPAMMQVEPVYDSMQNVDYFALLAQK